LFSIITNSQSRSQNALDNSSRYVKTLKINSQSSCNHRSS